MFEYVLTTILFYTTKRNYYNVQLQIKHYYFLVHNCGYVTITYRKNNTSQCFHEIYILDKFNSYRR